MCRRKVFTICLRWGPRYTAVHLLGVRTVSEDDYVNVSKPQRQVIDMNVRTPWRARTRTDYILCVRTCLSVVFGQINAWTQEHVAENHEGEVDDMLQVVNDIRARAVVLFSHETLLDVLADM